MQPRRVLTEPQPSQSFLDARDYLRAKRAQQVDLSDMASTEDMKESTKQLSSNRLSDNAYYSSLYQTPTPKSIPQHRPVNEVLMPNAPRASTLLGINGAQQESPTGPYGYAPVNSSIINWLTLTSDGGHPSWRLSWPHPE